MTDREVLNFSLRWRLMERRDCIVNSAAEVFLLIMLELNRMLLCMPPLCSFFELGLFVLARPAAKCLMLSLMYSQVPNE
jgi:hypothetical protein